MILLVLVLAVHLATACLQGAPDITSVGNPNSTPTGIQGIVLSSSFSCEGRVTGWTACFASDPRIVNYTMQFYVWRQGNNGCYELLGTNVLPATVPNSNAQFDVFDMYCIKVQVPRDQQIVFRPNDYIGFSIAINGQLSASSGGLLLDVNTLGSIVLGSGPCFGLFAQFAGPIAVILGAPLLSALVDDIAEGDTGPVLDPSASMSLTHMYNVSSVSSSESTLPVSISYTLPHQFPAQMSTSNVQSPVQTHSQSPVQIPISSQTQSPVQIPTTSQTQSPMQVTTSNTLTLAQISTAYTQSPSYTSNKATTATQSATSPGYTVQANGSMRMSTETTSERPWLNSPASACNMRPSTSITSTGEAEETHHGGNELEPTTTYILAAVGIILTITSTILAIAAVFCIWKCKRKKQTSRSNRGQTRVASEFIYNSTYERYMGHSGLISSLRQESTQYHSHWSLTHCDDGNSISESYPSLEMTEMDNIYNTQDHNEIGGSSSAENPQVLTAKQVYSKGSNATGNTYLEHSQRGKCDKGYTCLYDNPVFKRKQEERGGSGVSVYYSEPIKQAGHPSMFLSKNEAYGSTNPTSYLLSENEAYKSGHAGGAAGENAHRDSTDSVYYTRPNVISSEEKDEFGVSSNLAYGTISTSVELL